MRRSRCAFTLAELMASLAVMVMLATLLFFAAAPARERARQGVCISNLRQIGVALAMYRADYGGMEPATGPTAGYWQLGLPPITGLSSLDDYLKDRRVLHCPDYHGRIPAGGLWSTYEWDAHDNLPPPLRFSRVVARRGAEAPVVTCEQHNPDTDPGSLPRWATVRVIVLRLSGQVQSREVPITENFPDW